MTLDELNRQVTAAILRAESLAPESLEAWSAFREVSALEEAIASITPADDLPGEAARLGAVTAAIDAAEPLRAIHLAERFLGEGRGSAAARGRHRVAVPPRYRSTNVRW